MNTSTVPVKNTTHACEIIFLTVVIWLSRGYVWPTLSSVEVSVLQAHLDSTLFNSDFIVQESLRFTPRFYYNELILILAHCGFSLAWAFAVWHLVAIAALITGARSLAHSIGLGEVASAVSVLWVVTISTGTLGDVFFYTHAPVPAVWAGAIVIWGAVLAVRRHWFLAYACFGSAVLLQFLVGFYAGLLALPALKNFGGKLKVQAVAIWSLGLFMVFGPMWLSGVTGAGELDNTSFVEIYAKIRHPHHLVPTSWGWQKWADAMMFYVGAWWFLRRDSEDRSVERLICNGTLLIMVGGLIVNYIGVEVWPLAWVAKLQPGRITPLAQMVFLFALVARVHTQVRNKDYVGPLILTLIVLSPAAGFLLLIYGLAAKSTIVKFRWFRPVAIFAVVLAYVLLDHSIKAHAVRYVLWAVILGAQLACTWLRYRPMTLGVVTAGCVCLAAICAKLSVGPAWPSFLAARFTIDSRAYDGPSIIGQRFARNSPKSAVVMIAPTGETWSFKLFAQRAVVVDDKNFPFTDRGIREWKRRMEDVLGAPLTADLDPTRAWRVQSPASLANTAARYSARYILTRDIWHPSLPGKKIDEEQGWALWELD